MDAFTVFIPVYNEELIMEQNVKLLREYLDSLQTPYEIVIGSNGSTDKTVEIGERLQQAYPNLKFVHTAERGVGNALRKAIPMMTHEHVISADMDLSVDLNFIKQSAKLLSDYDIVVGSKRMGSQERSMLRKVASASFIFCSMLLLRLSFDDYSLAAKAYKKKILLECADKIDPGTFYVIEILYHAGRRGYSAALIPAPCHDTRVSKFNLWNEGVYRFAKLFRLWWKG